MRTAVLVLTAVMAFTSSGRAQVGVFWNFSQWEQKSSPEKMGYIAGAVDSLVVYANTPEEQRRAQGVTACLRKKGITLGQLTDNVLRYGQQSPELKAQPVELVLVRYLTGFCGH